MQLKFWVTAIMGLLVGVNLAPAKAASVYGKVYDTLRGEMYQGANIEINTKPPRMTTTDKDGQYWFKNLKPGAYLVRITRGQANAHEVVGRLLVSGQTATTIGNLDISKIDPPHEGDEY
jgi:hypothetical protein